MQISCQCEVEKNGFSDKEINTKEKNKVLHVLRTTQQTGNEDKPYQT
jgi:hypothetical protein